MVGKTLYAGSDSWGALMQQYTSATMEELWNNEPVDDASVNAWREAIASNQTLTAISTHDINKDHVYKLLTNLFAGLQGNTRLQTLEISQCDVALARALKELLESPNRSITTLRLAGSPLGAKGGTIYICLGLKSNRSVTSLNLDFCAIGDFGLEDLAVHVLDNYQNDGDNEGNEGSVVESKASEGGGLAHLSVEGNAITNVEALATSLAANRTILELNLKGNTIGDRGSGLLAYALVRNGTIQVLNLESNEIGDEGAGMLADALKVNKSVVMLRLGYNAIQSEGAVRLAATLRVNGTLSSVRLEYNGIGDKGAVAIAQALIDSRTSTAIAEINLTSNGMGDEGASKLAELAKGNAIITTLILDVNAVGDKGAVALAETLALSSSLKVLRLQSNAVSNEGAVAFAVALVKKPTERDLNLSGNRIADVGLVALRWAMLRSPQAQVRLEGNLCSSTYAWDAITATILAPFHVGRLFSETMVWRDCLKQLLKVESRKTAHILLHNFLMEDHPQYNHEYAAVMAAWLGDVETTLKCLEQWPEQAEDVLRECKAGTWFFDAQGCLTERLAKGAAPTDVAAIHAAKAVAEAVCPVNVRRPLNIHLCGSSNAGKSALLKSLKLSYHSNQYLGRVELSYELDDVSASLSSTVSVDTVELTSDPVRVFVHDYNGREELRSWHATHLASPASLYLLVLPLWDKDSNRSVSVRDLTKMHADWLHFIAAIVPKSTPKSQCIVVLNFARQFIDANGSTRLYALIDDLAAAQRHLSGADGKLAFPCAPVAVNASRPASVLKRLVPYVQNFVAAAPCESLSTFPALESVCAAMGEAGQWPIHSTLRELDAYIQEAVKGYASLPEFGRQLDLQLAVMRSIAVITRRTLAARNQVAVFDEATDKPVSVNQPYWPLVDVLYDVKVLKEFSPRMDSGAPGSPRRLFGPSLLLTLVYGGAARRDKDGEYGHQQEVVLRLLVRLGVCIPVLPVTPNGARILPADTKLESALFWFPALNTTKMTPADAAILTQPDYIIVRKYVQNSHSKYSFPPGYFATLFAKVALQYRSDSLLWVYADGMELRCTIDNALLQVVIRASIENRCFTVTAAATGLPVDSRVVFDCVKKIKRHIHGDKSGWRRNVEVEEYGVYPNVAVDALSAPTSALETLLGKGSSEARYCALYFGLYKEKPYVVEEVLTQLTHEFGGDLRHQLLTAVDGVDPLAEVFSVAESLEAVLVRVEGNHNSADLLSRVHALHCDLANIRSDAVHIEDVARAIDAAAQRTAQLRQAISQKEDAARAELELKQIVRDLERILKNTQDLAIKHLRERERAEGQQVEKWSAGPAHGRGWR